MKKLIPLLLLAVMLMAGCDLAGITINTASEAPVISSFGASPPTIAAGEFSTLSWSVAGATTVSIDQGVGNVALTGSRTVMPTGTTVYVLTATNAAGMSTTATAQVIVSGAAPPAPTPIPTPTPTPTPTPGGKPVVNYFTANPPIISAGGSTILSWNVSNATSVNIDHGVGAVGLSGSALVSPATSTDYTLTATNAAGFWIKGTTVLVSGVPPPSFAVTSATASVDPPSFSGVCPRSKTFNFYAVITVNGPGMVTYRWEGSDGAITPNQSITFSGPGSQTVSTSWQLWTTGSYWQRVHIFSPNETISNQANFTLNCVPAPTGTWAGTWETAYGTMVLAQSGNQVAGTYENDNGHITGTVSGNVLTGTWSEEPTYSPANNDAGDVQLTISPDGNSFTGGWRHGSSGGWTMNWTGTKIF